jgi:hypothetical protein
MHMPWVRRACAASLLAMAGSAASAADEPVVASDPPARKTEPMKFADDGDRYDGDHLVLTTDAWGFRPLVGQASAERCAPTGAVLVVMHDSAGTLVVRFKDTGSSNSAAVPPAKEAAGAQDRRCEAKDRVREAVAYEIGKETLRQFGFKRSGLAFGALVVPFKFRLGVNELVTSSTVAPYLGWRFPLGAAMTFTPIASAGLALVPVDDPSTGKSETKSAFSAALGLVLTSSKNDQFQAGALIGRDFLGRADRARDPGSRKPWISLYLGYAIGN